MKHQQFSTTTVLTRLQFWRNNGLARLEFQRYNGLAQQQFNATNRARIPANGIKSDSARKFRGTTKPSDLGRITSPARHSSVSSTEGRQACRSSKDKSAGLTRNGASIAANSAEASAKKTKAHQPRPKVSPFPGQIGHGQTGHGQIGGYRYSIT